MAQISINDKNEETQLLREYILMERDKLDDGRKTFKEDKSKFEKFKMSLQAKSNQTESEITNTIQANEKLQLTINDKKKEEAQLASQISKNEEEIKHHKKNKEFLEELRNNFNPSNSKKNRLRKIKQGQGERDGNTFMTSVKGG